MAVEIYKAIQDNGTALWEEERPIAWLQKKRSVMPRAVFNAQYQNDPSGLRGVRYDVAWLQLYLPEQLPPLNTLIGIQGNDPATSEDKTSNYFGNCTAAKDPNTGIVYILGFNFANLSATKHFDFLKSQYHVWRNRGLNITKVRIESGGPQQATVQNLELLARRDPDGPIPLEVYKPKGSKEDRYDSLLTYLGNGTILFKGQRLATGELDLAEDRGFSEFYREFLTFPIGSRDDLLDAWYIAMDGIITTIEPLMSVRDELRVSNPEQYESDIDSDTLDDIRQAPAPAIAFDDSPRGRVLGRRSVFHTDSYTRIFGGR